VEYWPPTRGVQAACPADADPVAALRAQHRHKEPWRNLKGAALGKFLLTTKRVFSMGLRSHFAPQHQHYLLGFDQVNTEPELLATCFRVLILCCIVTPTDQLPTECFVACSLRLGRCLALLHTVVHSLSVRHDAAAALLLASLIVRYVTSCLLCSCQFSRRAIHLTRSPN
jgi:hypothetical protein